MSVISEERWVEHENYVKKSFPRRTSDKKHFGYMVDKEPTDKSYRSFCCKALLSYSTSGCYSCAICSKCGGGMGCLNGNPGLWQELDKELHFINTGYYKCL